MATEMRGEFEFISAIRARYPFSHLGDDSAVLNIDPNNHLLVSTDMLVEDIHFLRKWITNCFGDFLENDKDLLNQYKTY